MKKGITIIAIVAFVLSLAYIKFFTPIIYKTEAYEVNYTVEEATQAADTVIIGTVKKVDNPRWNGKDGKKPGNDSPNMLLIFKPTTVEVEEYLKNPQPQKNITIINPGGTIGRETVALEGIPSFVEGQKVVLFLWKDRDPGDGVKHYDPIWSFSLENNLATNMRTGEQLPLEQLKKNIK